MNPKRIKTTSVPKSDYLNYLKKAEEFLSTMQDSLIKEKWNSAGLNAIHSAISASDAVLVCLHGRRSTSPKHDDLIRLFSTLVKHKDAEQNINHLRKLIAMKNIVEYGQKLISQSEAITLSKHAERFFEWTRLILPKI